MPLYKAGFTPLENNLGNSLRLISNDRILTKRNTVLWIFFQRTRTKNSRLFQPDMDYISPFSINICCSLQWKELQWDTAWCMDNCYRVFYKSIVFYYFTLSKLILPLHLLWLKEYWEWKTKILQKSKTNMTNKLIGEISYT